MYGADEIDTTSREKVRENGEVFTPFVIVDQMNALIPDSAWDDPTYCFLEPTSGNGQFLVKIFEKRIAHGISIENALNTLIGMEINKETIIKSHFRLYERCVAQMEVEGMKKGSKEWFNRAVNIVAIVRNNVFHVDDSISYINSKLEKKEFMFSDPTGNNQVLSIDKQKKRVATIQQVFRDHKNGKITESLAPFFKVGK